ncbi:MAG: DUF3127 domain-containing protein [Muribaculaceae bacterium]|nr:DUF3127 domain-containing protein [Muribaculaceae bacterium]
MEVQGKIIQKLPLQSGTSKAGNEWRKQVYILETIENFPKKVAFDFFGDRINQYDAICEVGNTVKISYDIESREFNGRWYTDIRGWKAEPYDQAAQPAAQSAQQPPAPQPDAAAEPQAPLPPADFTGPNENDDIPF